ncbi:uncharacterized protein TRAVEDRAFT_73443 [Trametes versicolor FP-101664 SS1]|uniref:uncharacterized protein n=1 Tax=Trametes versicolor (strain FP-101664) TaxID=717944 RepID=UPI0004624196|nr:uncharacterized protein TRAVEDRAFT_73443 [Trametes versicolor FP-101664 SS1]EIW55597.1 hypothetical protein TRAVEDRAFT_73443 [Trametes versicolor FP-101664 SS1]
MPGPRGKGKSGRPKARTPSTASGSTAHNTYTIPEGFFADIDNAGTWRLIVDVLCEYLALPDLGTRSGLKKVHAHFPEMSKKLDTMYIAAQKKGNERLMGGIVGVWAKMCADSILRDKLFQEGLLSKVMPLIEYDSTRHMALNALSVVTHHGGVVARREIARKNPVLMKLIQAHPDDAKVLELATVTMAHATNAVLSVEDPPDSGLVKEIQVRNVLNTTVENVRKPIATHYMIDHAFGLLTSATRHCPTDCKSTPSMLTLLVSCLRSANIITRCSALGGLIRLTANESEPDRQNFDPQRLITAVQRGFPDNLSDLMMDYGFERCDTTLTLKSTADYQRAMMQCAQDHDLYSLGRTLAMLIQRTEFSIAEGMFQADGPRREAIDIGLPFTMWTDSLPHCARALRARGSRTDLDMADVLDLKFFIIRSRIPDAIALGQRAVERNPDLAYAYYAISMGADHQQGLRAVKKGLKCKTITPFVRQYLLWRAVEHAGDLGVSTLQDAKSEGKDYAEGIAFLMSAWEDAKTFTAEAPPDNRHMQTILNWYIILTIAIKGPELSEDLRELAAARRKLDTSTQFMTTIGFTIKNTQMRLARVLILELYPKAVKEWGAFVVRFDELDSGLDKQKPLSSTQADDDLAAWLDNLKLDDGTDEHGHAHPHACSHPKISMNNVALYRCSWCGNPSAVLRKCGGCGKTRYCDGPCQKKHWSEHKVECKSK